MPGCPRNGNTWRALQESPLREKPIPLYLAQRPTRSKAPLRYAIRICLQFLFSRHGCRLNLFSKVVVDPSLQSRISFFNVPFSRTANKKRLQSEGVVHLDVGIGALELPVRFVVLNVLGVDIIVGTALIERFVGGILPPMRRILLRSSTRA